jgi:hypothetical protein
MHAQRRAGWRGDTLARVVRCIREAMPGNFGGWLDPVPEHGPGYVLHRLPPSHRKDTDGRYSSHDGNVVRGAMPFPTPVTKQRRQKYKKITLPPDRVEDQISVGSHRTR